MQAVDRPRDPPASKRIAVSRPRPTDVRRPDPAVRPCRLAVMTAVIGYFIVAVIAIGAALLVAGPHHVVRRDPTFELEDVASRQVPILGALAAFAVTGVVFLVTQASNVPDATSTSFTT